jgi:hypothetical protein
MPELAGWREFTVEQRRNLSGCIPTGFEMLVRAAGVTGVDLASFQDDFDLERDRRPGDPAINNFESVAEAVATKYPFLRFRRYAFPQGRGNDKLAFVESCLSQNRPVLVSLSLEGARLGHGWHIMLAIGDKGDELLLLDSKRPDGKHNVLRVPKTELVRIHDEFPGGDDVAVLEKTPQPFD